MGDFNIKVTATVDTTQIQNALNKNFKLNNITPETGSLISAIQSALNSNQFKINLGSNGAISRQGATAGTNYMNGFVNSTKKGSAQLAKSFTNATTKQFNQSIVSAYKSLSNNQIQATMAKYKSNYENLLSSNHGQLSNLKSNIEEMNAQYANMVSAKNIKDTRGLVQAYKSFNDAATTAKNTVSLINSENKMFASGNQIERFGTRVQSLMDMNTVGARKYRNELTAIQNQLSASNGKMKKSTYDNLQNQYLNIKDAIGRNPQTYGMKDILSGSMSGIGRTLWTYFGVQSVISGAKQMYNNVRDIDSEMVVLKRVTNETDETYGNFLTNAQKRSQELGTTMKGYISSTTDFIKLGYSLDDAKELSEVANVYATIGNDVSSVDEASSTIISTLKAFYEGDKNVGENALSIIDKFNEIGNKQAITAGGIGQAMLRSASSFAAANNTLDESIALIAAGNTIVQDPESVGTAFKTLTMRIRGAKTELEEAGLETDGMAGSVSKLRDGIKTLTKGKSDKFIDGIDIMEADNATFKSTYQILDELSQVWDKLSDIDQANILEQIAGKRQGNIVSGLLKNFDVARETLEQSMGASGSATKEHDKWLNSIEAKQLQLKAAWEGLSNDFLASSSVKGAVDGLRAVVNGVDSLTNSIGSLGTLATGFGLFNIGKYFKANGFINSLKAIATNGNSTATALAAIPTPILAIGAAVAATTVGVIAYNKHLNNVQTGAYLQKDAEKISETADKITKLNDLSGEVKKLDLVINNPKSSTAEIEQAKQRLQEIADLLNQEYNLKIKADTSDLETALSLLTKEEHDNLQHDIAKYQKDLSNTLTSKRKNINGEKISYKDMVDPSSGYLSNKSYIEQLSKDLDSVNSLYRLSERNGDKAGMSKYMQEYTDLISKAQLKGIDLSNLKNEFGEYDSGAHFNNIKDLSGMIEGYSQAEKTINNVRETSKAAADALAKVYKSDILTKDKYSQNLDALEFTELGKSLIDVGESAHYVGQQYATAKQGLSDWSEIASKGGKILEDSVNDYISYSQEIGESNENIARGAAVLKQGYSDLSQIKTDDQMFALYKEMQTMGEKLGISDVAENALQGTALMSAGFHSLSEAIQSGDKGITEFVQNYKTLKGKTDEGFAKLDVKGQENALNTMAHSIGLLPDDKTIKINVETGEVNIEEDIQGILDKLWGGDTSHVVTVSSKDVDVEKVSSEIEKLDGKKCEISFTADGTPALATIDETEYKLQQVEGSDHIFTFTTESGNAIGQIDLLTGKIDLLPTEKKLKVSTEESEGNGIDGIIQKAKELESAGVKVKIEVQTEEQASKIKEALGDEVEISVVPKVEKSDPLIGISADAAELDVDVNYNETNPPDTSDKTQNINQQYTQSGTPADTSDKTENINQQYIQSGSPADTSDKTQVINATWNIPQPVFPVAPQLNGVAKYTCQFSHSSAPALSGIASYTCRFTNASPPTLHGTVVYSSVFSGGSPKVGAGKVDGTAYASGTAFATGSAYKSGDWGIKTNGIALGGELGEELVVRNGKFFTIGSQSAEFFRHQRGDIIFNANQTKEIFEKGKITQGKKRGQAFASGIGNIDASNLFKDNSGSSDKSKHFDWVERYLKILERATKKSKDLLDNEYKAYETRINALEDAVSANRDEVAAQESAYNVYMAKANSIGLSEEYVKKIQDGTLDISTISNETLQKNIDDYQNWYDKALKCKEAIDDLNKDNSTLYKTTFKNIESLYDDIVDVLDGDSDLMDAFMDESENLGLLDTTKFYREMSKIEEQKIEQFKREYDDLSDELQKALDTGAIEMYSEAWYNMKGKIDDVTLSIQKSRSEIAKLEKEMREITWDRFDFVTDTFDDIIDEADFLIDLMDSNKDNAFINPDGGFTDIGQATLGLHGVNYNTYMIKAQTYANEIAKINKQLLVTPYDSNLIERRNKLLGLQRKSILEAKKEKDAMIDLVDNGYDEQLDALDETIDKYKDALDSEKELHDYQKRVREKTADIASIQKQLAAYIGDTSEETQLQVQKLKKDLKDAQEDLDEIQYERYIKNQKELLDNFYDDYEEHMDKRLDDIDGLFDELISDTNSNASSIEKTLSAETDKVGTNLSQNMKTILTTSTGAITSQLTEGVKFLDNGYFEGLSTNIFGIYKAVNTLVNNDNNIIDTASNIAQYKINPEGYLNYMKDKSLSWFTSDAAGREQLSKSNQKLGTDVGLTYSGGNWYKPDGSLAYEIDTAEKVRYIISAMRTNSEAWHSADSSKRLALENSNIEYANMIQSLTGEKVYKKDGVWYIGDRALYAYKNGGMVRSTGLAWLDGTSSKPELILNAKDTQNFIALKDMIANLGVSGLTDISEMLSGIRGNSLSGIKSIGDINISIPIDKVENYEDFITKMQKDKQFEHMIQSMSVNLLSGGSTLAKNKFRW